MQKPSKNLCKINQWISVNTYFSSIFVFGKDFFLAYIFVQGESVTCGDIFSKLVWQYCDPPLSGEGQKTDRQRQRERKIERDKERERKRYIQKRTKERDTLRDRKQSVRENELRKSPSIVAAYFYPQLCKEILLLLFGKINFNRIKVHENWKSCEEVFFSKLK